MEKICPVCKEKHNNDTYCSAKCHYDAIGRKKVVECNYCHKQVRIKKTNKCKQHFCNKDCWQKYLLLHPVKKAKDKLVKMYNDGMMVKEIAEKEKIPESTLNYHFNKWGLKKRNVYDYEEYRNVLLQISKQKSLDAKANYLKNYNEGKIKWRMAHRHANMIWGITEKPCEVCGWNKAERDMHLINPHILEKNNAISLCPNCHRLAHRGQLKLIKKI